MPRQRFVTPEVVRLPLSDGDWIEVKKRLSVGEARFATSSFIGTFKGDGSRTPNLDTLGMGNVLAYLVRWSFRDAQDLPTTVSLESLKLLDMDTYREIEEAIDAHEQRVALEGTEQEKKSPGAFRARCISDFVICREMHWTLADLLALPVDHYDVLLDWLGDQMRVKRE